MRSPRLRSPPLKIFVSSTSDLAQWRAKVSEHVASLEQLPIKMETFSASPGTPLRTCRDHVRRCDALVVLVGHRYGWIPTKEDGGDGATSITWWEVRWAVEAKKPVFAFLVDPAAPWQGAREQDRLIDAATKKMFVEIGLAVRQLQAFRTFLERGFVRSLFDTPDDLAAKVVVSLTNWLLARQFRENRARLARKTGSHLPALSLVSAAVPAPHGASSEWTVDVMRWREHARLISAERLVSDARGLRIALLAGRANEHHPALAGAAIVQVETRGDGKVSPCDDHTTSMAALLVADSSEYRGVAPGAELAIFNVFVDNLFVHDIVGVLQTAIEQGAQVICIPIGYAYVGDDLFSRAFKTIAALGVTVVCAAGNRSQDRPSYPASEPNCIAVAAVDDQNRRASFSNYGDQVTIAALGVDCIAPGGEKSYARFSGTGCACVITAGAVALMLKVNPDLTLEQVKTILQHTGPRALSPAGDALSGQLRVLDVSAAVLEARARSASSATAVE